jgi:hypothetical protein
MRNDLANLCEPVARIVWGEPSSETARELRWGTHGSRVADGAKGVWHDHERGARAQLPNRRPAETFELTVAGLQYTATVGRFADGRVREIFLTNHKTKSAADSAARGSAIVFSIAVQSGADVESIRKALCRDSRGRASRGSMTSNFSS